MTMRLPASRPAVGSSQSGWKQRARARTKLGVAVASGDQVAVDHHRLIDEGAETGEERAHDTVPGDPLAVDDAGAHQDHLAALQGADQHAPLPGIGHEPGHGGGDA